MSKPWPKVKLGEVLRRVLRDEVVEATSSYRMLGVRLDGQGPFLREVVTGGQTSANKLSRVSAGDFIYSRLFAWRGAFGIIGPELDGCYVSGEFPTFLPESRNLDLRFLRYWFRLRTTLDAVDENCSGSTPLTRNRFKEEFFLSLQVPLPSLAEQKRIVARIEELSAHIIEARELRRKAGDEAAALLTAARRTTMSRFTGYPSTLNDVCVAIIDNLHSNPRLSDTGVPCVRSPDVGYGTLNLEGAQRTDEGEFNRRTSRGQPQTDDIVLVREGGGTGKCALVREGQRFSLGQRVMMIRPNTGCILPKFFLHQLLSPLVQEEQIAPLSKGSASPHLNIGALKTFNLNVPPLLEQRRAVAELDALQAEVDSLKRLQADTAAELDALLPSVLDKAFKGDL